MRLTIRTVETLRPAAVRREIPDSLMVGLYCVIHSTGRKVWAVRYRFRGLNRKLTLGPYPAIGLKDARELAGKALRAVAEGRDPGRESSRPAGLIASIPSSTSSSSDIASEPIGQEQPQKPSAYCGGMYCHAGMGG